jgi:dCMP deaminase
MPAQHLQNIVEATADFLLVFVFVSSPNCATQFKNNGHTIRNMRPSWDDYFKEIVQVTAKRSPCERLHVGCLLVSNNRIVSQGYNGFLSGCEHISVLRDGHEQATVHAEQNAVTDCAKRGVSSLDCTAYITHFPCIICCRILLAAGIRSIKYIHDYKNDELVERFCKEMWVPIEKI